MMNRQDLEHAIAEGRTVEARNAGPWFRPIDPMGVLDRGLELRIVPDGDDAKKIDALIIENEKLKAERNRSGVELRNAVAKAVREEREAWPNLQPVISWLENGCNPKEAAKELRIYDEAIRTRSTQ